MCSEQCLVLTVPASMLLSIWVIIFIFNVTFCIVNKLSYNMVTQLRLNTVLSFTCSFLQRGSICTWDQMSLCFVIESQAPLITKWSRKCRILLYSSRTRDLASLTDMWDILNSPCLFLGINQWFLLVLLREGHHWWIWTAQFFQSPGCHQADLQFSYRIHPGMCYEMFAYKWREHF